MTTKTTVVSKVFDTNTDIDNVVDEMRNAGCKYLASGAYGSVYSSTDKDVVYKIFDLSCNTGYLSFLEVALRHQGNPFFPVIYSVNYYYTDKSKTEGVAIVEMERLSESKDEDCDDYYKTRRWFQKKVDPDGYGIAKGKGKPSYVKQAVDSAFKAAYALKRKFQKVRSGVCIDMHSGNFMFRNVNGVEQLVITDPFV